ncbi:hypothetical protein ACQ4PT_035001 [Festuca glaucescens]
MAPSWVLLDRQVPFPHDPIVIKEGDKLVGRGCPPSKEQMMKAIALYLLTLKPDAQLVDPPNTSSLRMLPTTSSIPPLCAGVTSARISSSDKNLVALYAGAYRPGVLSKGCYLIYDARKNSLSTIPQLPFDRSHGRIGRDSALVVSDGEGDGYVLAELMRVRSSDVAEAALYLWPSSATEWVMKAGRLPVEICQPMDDFSADMCFLSEGSTLCWVDLFKGLLVCDLRQVLKDNSKPEFRFIPLPDVCPPHNVYTPEGRQLRAEEFRSMSYAQGAIRFVTMDGYVEHQPGDEFELIMWTLSSDLSKWEQTSEYNVGKIWEHETHQAIGMPKIAPSLPVLSMYEDGVVYLVFSDVRVEGCKLEYKGQYLLRVDMGNNTVQFYPGSTKWIHSQLMASDFSAYQQVSAHHPREVEASQLAAGNGKRMKL